MNTPTAQEIKTQPAVVQVQRQYTEKGQESIFERELYAAFQKVMDRHKDVNANIRIIAEAVAVILIGRLNALIQEEVKTPKKRGWFGTAAHWLLNVFTGK